MIIMSTLEENGWRWGVGVGSWGGGGEEGKAARLRLKGHESSKLAGLTRLHSVSPCLPTLWRRLETHVRTLMSPFLPPRSPVRATSRSSVLHFGLPSVKMSSFVLPSCPPRFTRAAGDP